MLRGHEETAASTISLFTTPKLHWPLAASLPVGSSETSLLAAESVPWHGRRDLFPR